METGTKNRRKCQINDCDFPGKKCPAGFSAWLIACTVDSGLTERDEYSL